MKNWNTDWINKVAEVLENSARAWRDGTIGWTQKTMARDGSGDKISTMCPGGVLDPAIAEVCSAGALVWQTKKASDLFYAAKNALDKKLVKRAQEEGLTYPFSLPLWNDMPGRTVEEVIDLFEATAKDLRNGAEI